MTPSRSTRFERVALVIGPCPYGMCGVGDYTRMLATALERHGLRAEVVESGGTAALMALRLNTAVKAFRPDVIHLQYPTAGFGKTVAPHIFSILNRSVLTVHELQLTHWLRQLSCYPLALRARHVIFTCESNRNYALPWAPWLEKKSSVIPLASNISAAGNGLNHRAPAEVIHFGLMRPNKGIEDVLEFARLAEARGFPLRVRVMGSSPPQHATYLSRVQKSARALSLIWDLNLSREAIAERLARATVAYLPFVDGASERRASLLAALANGVPVITTRGRFTPSGLDEAVRYCSTPDQAVAIAQAMIDAPADRENLAHRGREYAGKFSWENIAQAHVALYQRLAVHHANRH
jgi:glycosyltransferase involved in cell wall biosynthesis